jgi:hypothetical protein
VHWSSELWHSQQQQQQQAEQQQQLHGFDLTKSYSSPPAQPLEHKFPLPRSPPFGASGSSSSSSSSGGKRAKQKKGGTNDNVKQLKRSKFRSQTSRAGNRRR